jgi:hypothetical protein
MVLKTQAQCWARSEATACHKQCPDSRPGFSLPARPTGQSGRHDLAGGLGVATVAASAPMEQGGGGAPGKAVEGGAHPSGGAA